MSREFRKLPTQCMRVWRHAGMTSGGEWLQVGGVPVREELREGKPRAAPSPPAAVLCASAAPPPVPAAAHSLAAQQLQQLPSLTVALMVAKTPADEARLQEYVEALSRAERWKLVALPPDVLLTLRLINEVAKAPRPQTQQQPQSLQPPAYATHLAVPCGPRMERATVVA